MFEMFNVVVGATWAIRKQRIWEIQQFSWSFISEHVITNLFCNVLLDTVHAAD